MSIKKRSLAMSAALLMAVAACGHSQTSSQQTTSPEASAASTAAAAPAAGAASTTVAGSAANGAKVFSTNCSTCHGAKGEGTPGTFPPLAGNATVTGDATNVIHIVKFGLTGKISVNGHSFNGQMPPWASTLSNADIADVITYVRSSWGNKAPGVTAAQVASATK